MVSRPTRIASRASSAAQPTCGPSKVLVTGLGAVVIGTGMMKATMTTKTTTWAAQIAVAMLLLATGTVPASSGLLAGNSPLGKNTLEGGWYPASASVTGEPHRGCAESCSFDAAGLFVAPLGATERAGIGTIAPYAPRTANLPQTATMAQMLENGWIPHVQGITITDGTIRFADVYRLTQAHGIEFGLAREMVNGRAVYRLYSGGANAVTIGESGNQVLRVIGHTHPSGIGLPSGADIRNINAAFLNALETDPYARVPVRILIWGPGPGQTTPYYPNVLR